MQIKKSKIFMQFKQIICYYTTVASPLSMQQ
jgi:hypothetical protein